MQEETIELVKAPSTELVAIDEKALANLGLTTQDLPAIRDLALRIDASSPMSVSEFGRDVAEHTSRYADELLSLVRNRDLDEAGAKLTQVVTVARALNTNALADRRSRLPLVGGLIDKLRLKAGTLSGHFESSKEQIDRLVSEVEISQKGLAQRNTALEDMYGAVLEEYKLLGLHVAAGKSRLAQIRAEADALRQQADSTALDLQRLADLDAVANNLDIRVGNLTALQQSAYQTLPQIRVIQGSNAVLVDKFHTVREVTIPAWKRQFMLALSLNEQKNAVELADSIDATTQELLTRNAKLLHHNATAAAAANQRLVIDVKTLETVQAELIGTVEDVLRIQRDGVQQRTQAERQIADMRANFAARLAAPAQSSTSRMLQ